MKTISKVYDCLRSVQSLLYPRLCALCGRETVGRYDLCPGCLSELPYNHLACRCCALPLSAPGLLCGACSDSAPPYERAI
ncbi:MAG TPA: double zinc ribbon domain-containing protein, partial [Gammaproteobacteria bacterium]